MNLEQPVARLLLNKKEMDAFTGPLPSEISGDLVEDDNELAHSAGPEASGPFSEYRYFRNYIYRPESHADKNLRTVSNELSSAQNESITPFLPASRTDRQQSVPLENVPSLTGSQSAVSQKRRKSSSDYPTTGRTTPLMANTHTIKKVEMRSRHSHNNGVADVHPRSGPGTAHPSPSLLESIPQGQELSIHIINDLHVSAPISLQSGAKLLPVVSTFSPSELDDGQTNKCTPSPVGLSERLRACPGCACPIEESVWCAPIQLSNKNKGAKHFNVARTYKSNHNAMGKHNSHIDQPLICGKTDNRNQLPSSSQWAKELIGRIRTNTSPNVEHAEWKITTDRRTGSTSRSSLEPVRTSKMASSGIDPRRLPKTSGPASACLEFAKKPLNLFQSPSNTNPIPVVNNRNQCATNSAAVTSSSWRPGKSTTRYRWFSQSSSVASGNPPSDTIFGPSSLHTQPNCSAVEEFQCAVDILSGRNQTTMPSGVTPVRANVRVKRASESDRFLVISKSLSDSKEDFSPCALEHFDDNHVYNALFRHSTCYDVLPDSGKLVILDSRLGIVRAIRALLENGVPAAPIWHSATQRVTGLLSQELALHLLNSLLCYSSTPSDDQYSIPTLSTHLTAPADTIQPASIADGLSQWGAQHLCDVLRLFHSDPDKSRYSPSAFDSALVVSPQTRLKRALCRLIHFSHRVEQLSRCHLSSHFQSMDDTSENRLVNSLRSNEIGVGRSNKHPIRQMSDPAGAQSFRHVPTPLPSPTHLIVMNQACGNVLGVLGVDRLLAYLRLRLDELSCSAQMLCTVDSISGLRWSDRQRQFKTNAYSQLRRTIPDMSADGNIPEPPILRLTTTCREALCSLSQWLPQLPAVPVITSNEGATATSIPNPLVGLIAPGDLLHYFLDGCPDTAASQPVSKIMEVKLAHCRFLHECVCHTQETLVDLLDRMFRLRTPCLVLFDAPRLNLPSIHGLPVGMVTAKDLLCAILGTKPGHHHHAHHHSGSSHDRWSSPSESRWFTEAPMELFEDDLNMSSTEQLPTKLYNYVDCSPSADIIESSSSDDSSSASSDSTYSGKSGSAGLLLTSASSKQSAQCQCSCHHTNSSKRMETSAPTPDLEGSAKHLRPISSLSRSSPSTRVHQGVRFLVTSSVASQAAMAREMLVDNPSNIQSHVNVDQRKNGRRGDEDDVLFPMD